MDEPGLRPMSPVILVAPVFVIEEPARMARPDEPASDTEFMLVVWMGITTGLVCAGLGSSLSQPANKTTDKIERAVKSFVVIIFLVFTLRKSFLNATKVIRLLPVRLTHVPK